MGEFLGNRDGGKTSERGLISALYHLFRQGYASGWSVSQRGAGANMSVDVAAGGGLITALTDSYHYEPFSNATKNVTVDTADPTNPRKDIVVAYIDLSVVSSASNDNPNALKFKAVAGTPAASPSDPSDSTIQTSVGAGNPWIKLARLAVGASDTSIVNADITDLRTPAALKLPYLYGGGSNTNGHLVPNVADDTVALLNAVQTFSGNKTFSGQVNIDGSNIAGAWQSWTPTYGNLSGGTTVYAKYKQIGKTVFFRWYYAITGANVSGGISISLPVAASSDYTAAVNLIGQAQISDTGTAVMSAAVRLESTTLMSILAVTSSGSYTGLTNTSSTIPHTWANTDSISAHGFYEVA